MVQIFTPVSQRLNESGILKFYYKEDNLKDIVLTASVGDPYNIVKDGYYYSSGGSSDYIQHIQVEIKNKVLTLSHYFINCFQWNGPSCWNFSISYDGINWAVYHSIKDRNTNRNRQVLIPVKTVGVKFIRWTQTEMGGFGTTRLTYMRIDELDIFGSLYNDDEYLKSKFKKNCTHKLNTNNYNIFIALLFIYLT